MTQPLPRILMVCLGNICRSPLAEGIMRRALPGAIVDSAGTGAWHVGDPPHPRSIATAKRHGVDVSAQRARQVSTADFDRFDLILAMDASNLAHLRAMQPVGSTARVCLFMDEMTGRAEDVPDPYYGDETDYEQVFAMLDQACQAWVTQAWVTRSGLSARSQ